MSATQYKSSNASVQQQQPSRQRYRREVEDVDTGPRASYIDPYDYDYPPPTTSANTAAARQSPHGSIPLSPTGGAPASPSLGTSSSTRQRPPSYDATTEQLSRVNYNANGDRRRSQPASTSNKPPSQTYGGVLPPSQAPAGSRSMPAGNALLRQTQAQQGSAQSPRAHSSSTSGVSGSASAQAAAGASISRLKTPSVIDSVLHPLGVKVQEYDRLMRDAQDDMKRLDDELRALQKQRDEAENRFLDADARHKEWQQQYDTVSRTLRGELPVASTQPPSMSPATKAPPQSSSSHNGNMNAAARAPQHDDESDDEDDDDEDDHEPVYKRPWSMDHQASFASNKSKGRRSRLMSLFGA